MNSLVTEVLAPRYGIAWYPWAVTYFFMIAISYSSLVLTVPGLMLKNPRFMKLARLALLVCVSTTLVGPVALLADLHQPLRFWHFYAHPTPWSLMSLGAFMLPVYLVCVVAFGYLTWRPAMQRQTTQPGLAGWIARMVSFGQGRTPQWLVIASGLGACIMGVGVMLYTGGEVAILKARPLWHTIWLLPMFALTGLIAAVGLTLLLNFIWGQRDEDVTRQSLKVMLVTIVLAALVALAWLFDGSESVNAALASVREAPEWLATAGWSLAWAIILFVLCAALLKKVSLQRFGWVVALIGIHIGWTFRWVVLMEVQTVAKNTAGYYHYAIDMGSYGLMGIIGIFGLWLAAILLVDLFVPWREAGQPVASQQ